LVLLLMSINSSFQKTYEYFIFFSRTWSVWSSVLLDYTSRLNNLDWILVWKWGGLEVVVFNYHY
jgi:hypothetical protein